MYSLLSKMLSPTQRSTLKVFLALCAPLLLVLLFWSRREHGAVAADAPTPTSGAAPAARPQPRLEHVASAPASLTPDNGHVLTELTWGSGPSQFGRPTEEEGQDTGVNMTVDSKGDIVLLDRVNGRILRVAADGKFAGAMPLPNGGAVDVAVAKDGTLAVLGGEQPQRVTLLGVDGNVLGSLRAESENGPFRGVTVAGRDVFAESHSGELVRLGDIQGADDGRHTLPEGRPMRDGHGFLSAVISDAEAGTLHVYVLEGEPLHQRFSRQAQLNLTVEGLFLVDTDAAGVIYIGLTGMAPSTRTPRLARLVCFEPQRGNVVGTVDLPIKPEETIVDAAVPDSGGMSYAVWTRNGLRLVHAECR